MTMMGMPGPTGSGTAYGVDFTLLDSESALWQMIARLPGMLWIANAAGRLDFVSPQWLQETGCSLNQILGFAWQSRLHPEDQARIRQQWSAATSGTEPFELDFRLSCANDDYRWFSMRARPVFNFDGTPNCWLGLCFDMSECRVSPEKVTLTERH